MYGELACEPIQKMASIVYATETAMRAEGVSDDVIKRVTNRLVWGHPEGFVAVVRVSAADIERAKTTLSL